AAGTDDAVGAWLQGLPWQHLLPASAPPAPGEDADARRVELLERELGRLRAAVGVAREGERTARDELPALPRQLPRPRPRAAPLQRGLRRLGSDADRARSDARALAAAAEQDARQAADDRAAASDERAHAAAALRVAAAERASAREEQRTGHRLAESRVRLLLD